MRGYSLPRKRVPSVGLCFSGLRVFSSSVGVRRVGGGAPMCSRAAALTALVALNRFDFFFLGIVPPAAARCV